MRGRLVILSGPSGVGKDTVIDAWRARDPRVQRVVAYTTRTPRTGEVDGVDYRFVSREEFDRLAASGAFLEHKEVHGNGYATPAAEVERLLAEGKIAVLKIDVQGAAEVRRLRTDALSIFILPPSEEELEKRIRARATEGAEAIRRRMENARAEMAEALSYDVRVVNDDVARCVDALVRASGE